MAFCAVLVFHKYRMAHANHSHILQRRFLFYSPSFCFHFTRNESVLFSPTNCREACLKPATSKKKIPVFVYLHIWLTLPVVCVIWLWRAQTFAAFMSCSETSPKDTSIKCWCFFWLVVKLCYNPLKWKGQPNLCATWKFVIGQSVYYVKTTKPHFSITDYIVGYTILHCFQTRFC